MCQLNLAYEGGQKEIQNYLENNSMVKKEIRKFEKVALPEK